MAGLTPPNNDTDQYGYLVTTEYGRSPYNAYQIQNVSPQVFGLTRLQAGELGTPIVTLTTALAASTAFTSLAVSALPVGVASGQTLVISAGTNPATAQPNPATSQIVVTSGATGPGATSVSVTSFTTNNLGYPVGSFIAPILLAGVTEEEAAPVVAPEATAEEPEAPEAPAEDEAPESHEESPVVAPESDTPAEDAPADDDAK